MNDHRPTVLILANANETATKQENETMLALCPYTDMARLNAPKRIKIKEKDKQINQ
jgi:hypothetical protein